MQTQKFIANAQWDDEDCTVDDECSASSSVNIPHETTKFINTLRDNKGNILPEDIKDFILAPPVEKIDTENSPSIRSDSSVSDFEDEDFCYFHLNPKQNVQRRSMYNQREFFMSNKVLWESCKDKPSKEIL